jgi:hypothetical protein
MRFPESAHTSVKSRASLTRCLERQWIAAIGLLLGSIETYFSLLSASARAKAESFCISAADLERDRAPNCRNPRSSAHAVPVPCDGKLLEITATIARPERHFYLTPEILDLLSECRCRSSLVTWYAKAVSRSRSAGATLEGPPATAATFL